MFRIEDRDVRFNLYDYLNAEELVKLSAYEDFDKDTFDILLDNAAKMAKDVIAPTNQPGDREGCHQNPDGSVTIPECYHDAYKQYSEGDWIGLSVSPEHGGSGLPQLVGMAAMEMMGSANIAFAMYPGLTRAAAALICDEGSEAQHAMFVEKMLSGVWGGTMCLTESGAGSAVGDNKTTAEPIGEGWYKIVGQKIFISSGEHPMVENNVHLVLARTPDAPAGIKGLSLFIVPKYLVNDDGSVGEFNDVNCAGIEHKMGIKGSATCTMAFGDNNNCKGWIIGNEGDGIKIMFHMMNEARLGVGLQSLAVAAPAYNEALDYAKERIQGTDAMDMKDPNAKRVPIIKHPDVRRMLMMQRAYVHGIRALMYKTAKCADLALNAEGEEQMKAQGLLELLTPICKGYGSDIAFDVTRLAIQTLGGYGFISEYPCEQYMRDAKILSIYEGTNGIQAMDLVGRKMGMKGGMVFMGFIGELTEFLTKAKEHAATKEIAAEFDQALTDMQTVAMSFVGKKMEGDIYYVLLQATSFLRFAGNLVLGWLLGDQAMLAHDKLEAMYADKGVADDDAKKKLIENNDEAAFLDAKVKTATFFFKNLLPENRFLAAQMQNGDKTVMDITM